jgi:hypothetical protein
MARRAQPGTPELRLVSDDGKRDHGVSKEGPFISASAAEIVDLPVSGRPVRGTRRPAYKKAGSALNPLNCGCFCWCAFDHENAINKSSQIINIYHRHV